MQVFTIHVREDEDEVYLPDFHTVRDGKECAAFAEGSTRFLCHVIPCEAPSIQDCCIGRYREEAIKIVSTKGRLDYGRDTGPTSIRGSAIESE